MKTIEARVVKHTGSHYLLTALPEWNLFEAVVRGKIRLQKSMATNPIAVGDRVVCEFEQDGGQAVITEVLPRDNYIIRRSTNLSREAHIIASNVDRAFVVVTLAFPEVKLPFLDRILVTCGIYGIPAVIVLNKIDLLEDFKEEVKHFKQIYALAGYQVLETSVKTGCGIARLRELISRSGSNGGISLLSGVSGAGKSSLVKAVDPQLSPRIASISMAHLQGRHTTTFYEMYKVSGGGFIIDTPGIRSFGLLDVEPAEIYKYFPEMLSISSGCRFTPCTHTHEPHCAVKEAVDSGVIGVERYNSYLGMLEESGKYR